MNTIRHLSAALAALSLMACGSCGTTAEVEERAGLAADLGSVTLMQTPAVVEAAAGVRETPRNVHELTSYFRTPETQAALEAFDEGRNNDAARAFEVFAEARPDSAEGRAARFMALLARHDGGVYDPTATRLEAMAVDWPRLADYAWFYAGSAHHHAGRGEQARAALSHIPDASTLGPRASEIIAESWRRAGDGPAAIAELEAAVARWPGARPALLRRLAELRAVSGDRAGALAARRELAARFFRKPDGREAHRALGRDPGYSKWQWRSIAQAAFDAQVHAEALRALDEVRDAYDSGSPEHCDALVKTARTYEKLKEGRKAWRFYDKALKCGGDTLAYATFSGGRNRLRSGKHRKAVDILRRHVDEFPDRTTVDDALVMMAESLRHLKRDGDADAALMRSLEEHPEGDMADDAAWALLWPRIQAQDWRDALEISGRLLELVPRERSYRAEGRTLYWRGRVLQELDRDEEALASWRLVLQTYPLSWYAILAHGRLRQAGADVADVALASAIEASTPPEDPLLRVPDALWLDPHFRKAMELARMGLGKSARRELDATTVPPGDEGAERALVWTRIALYDLSGAYELATWLARRQESDFGAHWPVDSHRQLWQLAHPRPFADLVEPWAARRSIDPHWVWSIMREESGFDPDIESWANAIGLMQIILPTAEYLSRGTGIDANPTTLRDPAVSVELGSKFLASLLKRHPVYPLASAGYNAGGGAISKWRRQMGHLELDEFVESIPYREARGYAKRVTRSLARYRWLYAGGEMLELPMGPPREP